MSQVIVLLLFQTFKNINNILSAWAKQKSQLSNDCQPVMAKSPSESYPSHLRKVDRTNATGPMKEKTCPQSKKGDKR